MAGKHARARFFRTPTGLAAAGAVAVVLVGAGAAGMAGLGTEPVASTSLPAPVDATTPGPPGGSATAAPGPTPGATTAAPSRAPDRASRASSRPSPSSTRTSTKKPAAKRTATTPSARVVGNGSCGASYYDQGQVTANGEAFDPNAMTAAHKTLPFDTRVRVTNPDNGRSVVVRINDRGPFIAGRCIDLSRAAFAAIASLDLGAVDVRYEVLG
ncbi:septal ring lytic transglycosylase RlpA family protein [Plantactinospora sp. WMMC1484]|uniref:septal ring lytic transglycosylase RlpA family protein n=1 Tax=Plantactinospora sp. WMMC1484 TaxID=3404122 RepID=UPI003BF4A3A1